ncbi:hypothetical protein MKW94_003459 [Papaver nudicaule]|uniref:GCK domain-containing protein n=1 Tax=Papaver nudicaule TaxID=74823 RepID=A0AA41SDL6_PAPNU|nr:hypothetical protein [Papaver nudicaule]
MATASSSSAKAQTIKAEQNRKPSLSESIPSTSHSDAEKVEEGDEEEHKERGEYRSPLFKKGGGCRESYTAWDVCIWEGEKNKENLIEKCSEVGSLLLKCMLDHAHVDYNEQTRYHPGLRPGHNLLSPI